VFVVVSATTDDRVPASLAPVAVGAALAVAVSVGAPVTGGAVNPVRALGPALIAGQLPNIWIYIVGPLLGGVAAAFVYDRILAKAQAPALQPHSREDTEARPHPLDTCRFQNSCIAGDLRIQAARSYSLIRPPRIGQTPDPAAGRSPGRDDRGVWKKAQRLMWPSAIIVSAIPGKDVSAGAAP
jgi:Major intrinsic protein